MQKPHPVLCVEWNIVQQLVNVCGESIGTLYQWVFLVRYGVSNHLIQVVVYVDCFSFTFASWENL
jgi:hypothetical protein